ncbi:MAG: hypothetical protein ABR540_15170 [Acidimicrobiales bacterium]
MAPPVTTSAGAGWAEIDGVVFRCHGWVEGVTKENEEATALEACAMGRIVAQLHSLAIPVHDVEPPPPVHRERLVELVQAGQARRGRPGWPRCSTRW